MVLILLRSVERSAGCLSGEILGAQESQLIGDG